METLDCVVIGAGIYGLSTAKQYRLTRTADSLAILDSQSTLGGTWADERLYPDLKTNNLLGTYEFPDFPLDPNVFDVKPGQHMTGSAINAYLKAYAVKFGLDEHIRLDTKVISAEHQETEEGGWTLTLSHNGKESKMFARRLIVASGLTNEPFMPHFEGQDTFGGKIFHSKDLPKNIDTLHNIKTATIFGAGKFAWDTVYSYTKAGVDVNWVIRSSGHGPSWMTPPHVTPFKLWMEKLSNIRLLTWFSPCIWGEVDGYSSIRRFLHGTFFGRIIVDTFWKILGADVKGLNDYNSHPETAKLNPWIEPMYASLSFAILNYDENFFDIIKSGKAKIYISEIDHLSPGKVHLADGTSLDSEILLVHTGWKQEPPFKFLPEGIDREIGIPHMKTDKALPEDLGNHSELIRRADSEILRRFPRLRDQPSLPDYYKPLSDKKGSPTPYKGLTPYMLHRFMVPPSERLLRCRDIAFSGMTASFSTSMLAHMQSIWISAYFAGLLQHDPCSAVDDESLMQKLQYETVLHNRFGHWRHPMDWGNKAPAFAFDAVPYYDLLQRDLGVNFHRKSGLFGEIWKSYGLEDYRYISDEVLAKAKQD